MARRCLPRRLIGWCQRRSRRWFWADTSWQRYRWVIALPRVFLRPSNRKTEFWTDRELCAVSYAAGAGDTGPTDSGTGCNLPAGV